MITKRLFIDTKNLKVSIVTIVGAGSNSPRRTEERFSISKSVKTYGLENHIEYMKDAYKPTETILSEI